MDLTMAQPTSVSFPHWVRALFLSWICGKEECEVHRRETSR